MTAENTVWVSAKISSAHMEKLDALADATRTNRSEVLRMLIEAAEVDSVPAMRYASAEAINVTSGSLTCGADRGDTAADSGVSEG